MKQAVKISRTFGNPKELYYSWEESVFGSIIVASDTASIFYLSFYSSKQNALDQLSAAWKGTQLIQKKAAIHARASKMINGAQSQSLSVVIKGTDFQHNVWCALINIKRGKVISYEDLAKMIDKPKAVRAVATAVGKNKIAILVPCHRVIRSNGGVGKYAWGAARKKKILNTETT